MLGQKSSFAEECFKGNFIGADFGLEVDLKGRLPDNWKTFKLVLKGVFQNINSDGFRQTCR